MSDISKYLSKPSSTPLEPEGRYERFNLKENPFPSQPTIIQHSSDARYNGEIYEHSIRLTEFQKLTDNFLKVPQADINHLRLGYLIDTSFIGRGNGKSAFLLNAERDINRDFCQGLSQGTNKCFALTVSPEPSGRTKTFSSFVELIVTTLFRTTLLDDALAALRLDAVISLQSDFDAERYFRSEEELRHKLSSLEFYRSLGLDYREVHQYIQNNGYLQALPEGFPLFQRWLIDSLPTQQSFEQYFQGLKPGKPQLMFLFSDLARVFLAAGFNGAFVFVDDFERIPDFQSERQKRDFAIELRSCLFDGYYFGAQVGFYNMLLVLHAGVPRLIQKAWEQAGLEHRAPIFYPSGTPNHVIQFEKIAPSQASDLIKRYLAEYRINEEEADTLRPFTADVIPKIAELGEYNASRILKMCYEYLERAVSLAAEVVDSNFLRANNELLFEDSVLPTGIHDANTIDLNDLAKK